MVPRLELGDVGTHGIDSACIIGAWDEREGRLLLVLAQYLKVLGVVQAGGFNFDSHYCRGVQLGNGMVSAHLNGRQRR